MSTILQNRPRVLIVDPIPETAGLIELILRRAGDCEAHKVEHPRKALNWVRDGKVDLVLMDAFFPDDASLDFCRNLRADPEWEHLPVILFSSEHDRAAMLRGFEAGAVDYLFKPLFPTELAARVRTHFLLKRQKDLTLRKVLEQRELLQLMCHDVSGPVGSVRMALEMCRDNPKLVDESIDPMIQALNRVLELTELVRKMRAFEDGKVDFHLEAWPLAALVDQAVEVVQGRLTQKSLKLKVELPPNLAVRVEAVSFVNSVMANLLSNAAKFSYPDSTIEIGAATEGVRVFVMVEDHGIGIPPKLQKQLFSPNQPTTRPGTENEPGTGYGMLLVKKFVEAYEGRVIVDSRDIAAHPKAHGTRMILDLPTG